VRRGALVAIVCAGTAIASAACGFFLDDLSDGAPASRSDASDDRAIATPDPAIVEELEAGPPPADIEKDTLNCAVPNLVLCDGFEADDLLDAGKWDRLRVDASVVGAATDAAASSGARSFAFAATTAAAGEEIFFLAADRLTADTLRQVIVEADIFIDPAAASFTGDKALTILGVQPAEEAGFASDQAPRATIVVGQGGTVTARVRTFGNDKEKVITLTDFTLGAWKRVYLYVRFAERNGELLAKIDKVPMGDVKAIPTLDKPAGNYTFNSVALAMIRAPNVQPAFVRFDNVHVRIGPQ
jgi:hypothetical protein